MKYFYSRRPQGFRHGFIYSDGKKEAKGIKGQFSGSLMKGTGKQRMFHSRWVSIVFPLILLLLLAFICYIMI